MIHLNIVFQMGKMYLLRSPGKYNTFQQMDSTRAYPWAWPWKKHPSASELRQNRSYPPPKKKGKQKTAEGQIRPKNAVWFVVFVAGRLYRLGLRESQMIPPSLEVPLL